MEQVIKLLVQHAHHAQQVKQVLLQDLVQIALQIHTMVYLVSHRVQTVQQAPILQQVLLVVLHAHRIHSRALAQHL